MRGVADPERRDREPGHAGAGAALGDVVRELQSFGITAQIADPLADPSTVEAEYGVALTDIGKLKPSDAVIMAVAHEAYIEGGWHLVERLLRERAGLVFDVKMKLDRSSKPDGIELWRL